MQKKLIALAIAGLASTAAFAQTNVTVYGIADGSFDYVWQTGGKLNKDTYTAATDTSAFTSQDANYAGNTRVSSNSSYFGFKGTEDLGNGLKAVFQYEAGLDFTSGSGFSSLASRDSFVGLSDNKFGTVVLGNLTGPTRALGAAVDVNPGATGIGANSGLLGKIAGSTLSTGGAALFAPVVSTTDSSVTTGVSTTLGYGCTTKGQVCASIFDTRWQNAIAYISPNISGFTFVGAYVANENKTPEYSNTTGAQTAAQVNTTGYDLGAKWEGSGFMVGVTYNWAQIGDQLDTEVDNLRIAGMYTAANWSVRALWEKTQLDTNNKYLGGFNTDQQKFGLGGTYTIGKTQLLAQWYGTNSAKDMADSKANLYEVGALYNLSKRTMLKATWAMIDNDNGSAADFGVGAVGGSSFKATASTNGNVVVQDQGFGSKYQGIQVGVRHAF